MSTTTAGSSWKDAEVAHKFLDERRKAIPMAAEQTNVLLRLIARFQAGPQAILDLGCGDGFLSRQILPEYPQAQALLLDHSEPMLERARAAMEAFAGRVSFVKGDLAAPLAGPIRDRTFDVVVSGYAIHHLPTARKQALYREIYELLRPGGLFVNVEHVASATPEVESLFDAAYIDHIAATSQRDRDTVSREYHARPDKADNRLDPVCDQVGWLREIGFHHADCYFKWFELAVFGGAR